MKKGDIVEIIGKPDESFLEAAHSMGAWVTVNTMVGNNMPFPTSFTVSEVGFYDWCGMSRPVLQFEELPGRYSQRHFKVVLPAGEPDVEQLLKESERMLVGF